MADLALGASRLESNMKPDMIVVYSSRSRAWMRESRLEAERIELHALGALQQLVRRRCERIAHAHARNQTLTVFALDALHDDRSAIAGDAEPTAVVAIDQARLKGMEHAVLGIR